MRKKFFLCAALLMTDMAVLHNGPAQAGIDPAAAQKLLAGDGAFNDLFGHAVSVSGNTAVIGAWGDDDKGSDSGSVYVFIRSETGYWTQQAKLIALDGAANDKFGLSVSISGDTVVVGSEGDDDKGADSGSAYVFIRSGTTWTQQAKLTAPDGAASDYFGHSVSVDGNIALIGADHDDDKGGDSGSAYVFIRSGTTWTQQAKLTAPDGAASYLFGFAVSLSGDSALVGSHNDDSSSGSAYVFVRSGTTWMQQAKLTASDGAAYDYFGYSVSLHGNMASVGAFGDDDKGIYSGSAYVFIRSGTTWTQQAKLTAPDGASYDYFGISVSISGDTAVVGSRYDDDKGPDSGSAYLFIPDETDNWSQQAKLTANDGAAGDLFGWSVALADDGTVLVGVHDDDDKGASSGSAYVFNLTNNDSDNDGILDSADNCPAVANPDQLNTDGDAQGDTCDTDDDNDTVLDSADNCPLAVNADQADNDGDSLGDICDDDDDNDTVLDAADNCKLTANQDQADADADGQGDACDGDQDGDGVANAADNCPAAANADQADNDGDAQGDACDADDDNDTVLDAADNCPADANADQKNLDGDNIGDVCDLDMDGDGRENAQDNCPANANADQEDTDFDGAGDACDTDDDNDGVLDAADNCSLMHNPGQENSDGDAQGDVCDGDLDGDGQANETDNCPNVANASQADFDGDAQGDVCDGDLDGDGAANSGDACGFTELNAAVNPAEGCSIAQLCPCEGPRGVTGLWKNHGQHVSCVAKSAESFVGLNLITEAEKDAAVSAAAESDCGAKK